MVNEKERIKRGLLGIDRQLYDTFGSKYYKVTQPILNRIDRTSNKKGMEEHRDRVNKMGIRIKTRVGRGLVKFVAPGYPRRRKKKVVSKK